MEFVFPVEISILITVTWEKSHPMRNKISQKNSSFRFFIKYILFWEFFKKEFWQQSLASLFNEQKNKSAADDTKKLISNNQ